LNLWDPQLLSHLSILSDRLRPVVLSHPSIPSDLQRLSLL
jgi:hypothetical protein